MRNINIQNKWVLLFVAALIIMASLTPVIVQADGHTLSMSTSITIADESTATVKHIISSKNSAASPIPKQVSINLASQEVRSLVAKAQDNSPLSVSASETGTEALVTIPESHQKESGSWSFTLSYSTDVLTQLGAINTAALPRFITNLDLTAETLTVAADLDLGFASVSGPQPTDTRIGIGQQILVFKNTAGALARSVLVQFGDRTYVDVDIKSNLKNNSWWWNDVSITLPPDSNQQHSSLKSIDPMPKNVRLDKDGNMLATYRLGPKQSIDVMAQLSVEISAQNYKFDDTSTVGSTDQLLVDRYTKLTDAWQPIGLDYPSDSSSIASEVVRSVYEQVVEKARAEEGEQKTQLIVADRNSALKYGDWLVGELRSRGVPARIVMGLLMGDGDRLSESGQQHAWVEAYVAGTGWITVDPWLGVYSDSYGSGDPLHIALGLWGLEVDRPPVPVENASVSYTEEPSYIGQEKPTLSLNATKYVWLPFVSVLSVGAELPDGDITDNVALSLGEQEIALGSLAPYQKVAKKSFRFGSSAFSSEDVSIYQAGSDSLTFWEQASSSNSYLPLYFEAGLLLVIGGFVIIRKRRGPRSERIKSSKESLTLHDEAVGGDIESENLVGPKVAEDSLVEPEPTTPVSTPGPLNHAGRIQPPDNGTITPGHTAKPPAHRRLIQ